MEHEEDEFHERKGKCQHSSSMLGSSFEAFPNIKPTREEIPCQIVNEISLVIQNRIPNNK